MAKNSAKKLATSQRKKWLTKLQPSAAKKSPGGKHFVKVVLDTNIWYSAIVYGGKPESAVDYCIVHCQIVVSAMLVNELIDRLKRKTDAPHRWLHQSGLLLNQVCIFAELHDLPAVVRDKKDNHIIAAAVANGCDYIITGDKDLLELESYRGIAIIRPAEFLELVG